MSDEARAAKAELMAAVADAIGAAPASELPGFAAVAAAVHNCPMRSDIHPNCPEVITSLVTAAEPLATSPSGTRLATAMSRAARHLHWYVPYADHTEDDMVVLHRGYFVAPIIGTARRGPAVATSEAFSVWMTIQAPELMYPSHVHKAPELYHVIAGTARWQKGGGEFTAQPPGNWIVHPTGTRHAMQTDSEPLLAMAIWTGDLDSTPVIVRD